MRFEFAAQRAQQSRLCSNVQVRLSPPFELLYKAGARVRAPIVEGDAHVQLFQEVANGNQTYLEQYIHAHPEHHAALMRYLAQGGHIQGEQIITYSVRAYYMTKLVESMRPRKELKGFLVI